MSQPSTPASGLSALMSLSQAALIAKPIPTVNNNDGKGGLGTALKHRRLSSTGQTRRRLSDARDAATRPNPASLHSAASALASLSLSSSTGSSFPSGNSLKPTSTNGTSIPIEIPVRRVASGALAKSVPTVTDENDIDVDIDIEEDKSAEDNKSKIGIGRTTGGKSGGGKKRGSIFRCESCSKVYRHPSCLVKHRWEHSPHWREASKFLLSKHQQVQLLEAAAILSHLAPGTSLPEDRSQWPFYLSGGALPPPSSAIGLSTVDGTAPESEILTSTSPIEQSSNLAPSSSPFTRSVARIRWSSNSTSGSGNGPRMHDYAIPAGGSVEITQIRPGLLGHPTGSASSVGSVSLTPYAGEPLSNDSTRGVSSIAVPLPTVSSPMAVPRGRMYDSHKEDSGRYAISPSPSSIAQSYIASSFAHSSTGTGGGGWSLPRSDLRSGSMSYSESRSRSGSRSDDEESSDEIEAYADDGSHLHARGGPYYINNGYGFASRSRTTGMLKTEDDDASVAFSSSSEHANLDGIHKIEEQKEEWDGMDMDMEF